MSQLSELASIFLNPSPLGLVVGVLLVITIPLFLHLFVFHAKGSISLPSILVIGPSGSGKTSLTTLFERGNLAETHTSQIPITIECSLPVGTFAASSKYRSLNDPSHQIHKKFYLIDTPGHGKLRHHAFGNIANARNLKGIIFLVDAASLSPGDESLWQTSEYLHNILLLLQRRMTEAKSSKFPKEIPILIAANKMDLFTAIPAPLVKANLEVEIGNIRNSKAKGILDSGIGMGESLEADEKDDWIGKVGSTEFKFSQMYEFNIFVDVVGGNVTGTNDPEVDKWWKWVGDRL